MYSAGQVRSKDFNACAANGGYATNQSTIRPLMLELKQNIAQLITALPAWYQKNYDSASSPDVGVCVCV